MWNRQVWSRQEEDVEVYNSTDEREDNNLLGVDVEDDS